jgi:spore coat polysaccharide biosynthesis protein SpsF
MTGVIIQARMGSTRLPGKILKKIGNKTLLEHIIFRLSYLKSEAGIVIATSLNSSDDVVYNFCEEKNIKCYRGSEDNVLSRYYECSKLYGFENIIRLTADNPFTDIEELDRLIESHIATGADYSHSFSILPIGVGAEIFTFNALEKSYREGNKPNHLEHVNEYIWDNSTSFKITILTDVKKSKQFPNVRLTIDTIEDYNKACFIVENCLGEFITTEEAIKLCLRYA